MSKKAYLNATLIDPETGLNEKGGILFEEDRILDLGAHLNKDSLGSACEVTILEGDEYIAPGLVDIRALIGEPGNDHKEDFSSACSAAAAGGITTLACLPETKPVIDNIASLEFVAKKTREQNSVKIHAYASLTKNMDGKDLSEIGMLTQNGAVGFTDCLAPIKSPKTLARALSYSKICNALIINHPNDLDLTGDGHMNKGALATRLGLNGIPREAEIIMLERDMRILEMTGGRYHAANISTSDSVDIIRKAKEKGLNVTCDTAAFYATLTENDVEDYRTFTKLMPPLRSDDDRSSIAHAIKDGTIDIITSDHRPEDQDSKRLPFADASIGAVGLETLLSLGLAIADETDMPLIDLIASLSLKPANLLGLRDAGRLKKNGAADFIIFSPTLGWRMDASKLHSKAKNTPFDQRAMTGTVLETVINGITHYKKA